MAGQGTRTSIPQARLDWLRTESARWRAEGLIGDGARAGILAGYEAESPRSRGMQVLVALGILICAIGLLLLIGYNWAALPGTLKVGGILTAVAAAFAASARAYATGRHTAGEWLAFAGVLIFANAIWLIAQVLHIQGHFPDGFLWAAVGALGCAVLLRSGANGTLAGALLVAWSIAEGLVSPGNNYLFLPIWASAVVLARAIASRPTVVLAGIAAVAWVAVIDQGSTPGPLWLPSIALSCCALYAAGLWEPTGSPVARAWQVTGMGLLLVVLVPLMSVGLHDDLLRHATGARLPMFVVSAAVAAVAVSGAARARTPADWGIVLCAIATLAWAGAASLGAGSAATGAIVFSGMALGFGIALVRTGLATGHLHQFVFGALFAAAFILVRWLSVVENMLWSGALLLAAGAGVLVLARLWRSRDARQEGVS